MYRLLVLAAAMAVTSFGCPVWAQEMIGRDAPLQTKRQQALPLSSFAGRPSIEAALPALTALEKSGKVVSDQLGIGRELDSPTARSAGSIHLRVLSADAALLRVGLVFEVVGRYTIAATPTGSVADPVEFDVDISEPNTLVWSPLTHGESQDIVVRPSDGAGVVAVRVARVSHLFRAPGEVGKAFGDSAACQLDFQCLLDVADDTQRPPVSAMGRAVMLLVQTSAGGSTSTCTGTLVNSANFPLPLVLTANHCVDDAASITSVWNYARTTCGSGPANLGAQVGGGGYVVWRSEPLDAALLILNALPPENAYYSGWDAKRETANLLGMALHHPRGDAKKASFGSLTGTVSFPVNISGYIYSPNTFYGVNWELGVVEPGSSGSGFFTYHSESNNLLLRGTLTGGSASCSAPTKGTYYSQLYNVFPYIASALTESIVGSTTTIVEYFHAGFGHYFVTGYPNEIQALDTNPALKAAWSRTGQTFNGYAQATSGAVTVHRFFTDKPIFGGRSSHFYTGLTNEYNVLQAGNIWGYEGPGFYVRLPSGSTCASGHTPVYRIYNNGIGGAPNHRFTTQLAIYNDFIYNRGWAGEGVVFCAPN